MSESLDRLKEVLEEIQLRQTLVARGADPVLQLERLANGVACYIGIDEDKESRLQQRGHWWSRLGSRLLPITKHDLKLEIEKIMNPLVKKFSDSIRATLTNVVADIASVKDEIKQVVDRLNTINGIPGEFGPEDANELQSIADAANQAFAKLDAIKFDPNAIINSAGSSTGSTTGGATTTGGSDAGTGAGSGATGSTTGGATGATQGGDGSTQTLPPAAPAGTGA